MAAMENDPPAGSGASSDFWRSGRWKEVPERPPLKDLFALHPDPLPASQVMTQEINA
jgi:hypothetical protein